jgi:hypothetical protein
MFCFAWQNAPLGRQLFDSTYISFGSHDALIDHVLETHWSQRYRHLLRHPCEPAHASSRRRGWVSGG